MTTTLRPHQSRPPSPLTEARILLVAQAIRSRGHEGKAPWGPQFPWYWLSDADHDFWYGEAARLLLAAGITSTVASVKQVVEFAAGLRSRRMPGMPPFIEIRAVHRRMMIEQAYAVLEKAGITKATPQSESHPETLELAA